LFVVYVGTFYALYSLINASYILHVRIQLAMSEKNCQMFSVLPHSVLILCLPTTWRLAWFYALSCDVTSPPHGSFAYKLIWF